jgi:hypothetical protein
LLSLLLLLRPGVRGGGSGLAHAKALASGTFEQLLALVWWWFLAYVLCFDFFVRTLDHYLKLRVLTSPFWV